MPVNYNSSQNPQNMPLNHQNYRTQTDFHGNLEKRNQIPLVKPMSYVPKQIAPS